MHYNYVESLNRRLTLLAKKSLAESKSDKDLASIETVIGAPIAAIVAAPAIEEIASRSVLFRVRAPTVARSCLQCSVANEVE